MGENITSIANLNYDKLKAKKPKGIAGLIAGKKIKKANAEIKAAVIDTNKNTNTTNTQGKESCSTGAVQNDTAQYELTEGLDNKEEGQDIGNVATQETNEANTDVASVQQLGEVALANTAAIQEMQTNCEAGKEAIVAQIQEALDTMNDAGAQIAANMIEAEALGAELEGITADEGGAGGFSTAMAAAGGENNAYGLNIPTGDNGAGKAGKAGKGGLISSGAQPTPGGMAPTLSPGNDASKTERTQAIYARLLEIENQNTDLQETIIQCSDTATELQLSYAEDTETNVVTTAEASNEQATQGSVDSQASGQAFAKITEYGNYTKLAGIGTQAVGVGMTVAGSTTETVGTGVQQKGGFFKGIGAGLKSLAAALLPGVFTAPAGGAVGGSSVGVTSAGVTTIGVGKTVTSVGKGLGQTGVKVQTVGKGIQAAGNATIAVGSAGTTVTNITNGNWLGALASGLSCLGSAASCIGDTAQFAAMVDQGKGQFLSAIQEFNGKMNNWMSNAMGKGDIATKSPLVSGDYVATGSIAAGNLHVAREVVGATNLIGNVATQGFTQASQALNKYMDDHGIEYNTTDTLGNATTQNGTETTDASGQPVDDKSQAYKDARTYGISASAIEGKSDAEIMKMIDEFHAGKINADGTKKTQG